MEEDYKEIQQQLIKIKTMSKYLRDCGKDFIAQSDRLDEVIEIATNPIKLILTKNPNEEIARLIQEVNLIMLITSNKITALAEYVSENKKEEENDI